MEVSIRNLVEQLPEIYQPIFEHPHLSEKTSRSCADRLERIASVHQALADRLGRPVRVLDLGCAQGYFSLALARLGAVVHGVDYLQENIALCNGLVANASEITATFELGDVKKVIENINSDQYDLVLGLSVFHHMIHGSGLVEVKKLIEHLSTHVAVGIYELAVSTEPVYWATSLPENPKEFLDDYRFIRILGHYPTHLSTVIRPLYLSSSSVWYVNNSFETISRFQAESHEFALGVHGESRKYFFSSKNILKQFSVNRPDGIDINVKEMEQELAFLSQMTGRSEFPELVSFEHCFDEIFLVRECLEGSLLSSLLGNQRIRNKERLLDDVLSQLVILEEMGLYHNDLRPWNILVKDNGHPTLIDFGALVTDPIDCSWPGSVFLSWLTFTREIFDDKVAAPQPIRPALLDTSCLPLTYKVAFQQLLECPMEQWSFARFKAFLAGSNAFEIDERSRPTSLIEKLSASIEELSLICNKEVQERAHEIELLLAAKSQATDERDTARQAIIERDLALQEERSKREAEEATRKELQAAYEALVTSKETLNQKLSISEIDLSKNSTQLSEWELNPIKRTIRHYIQSFKKYYNEKDST